jgi:hypothetical protein
MTIIINHHSHFIQQQDQTDSHRRMHACYRNFIRHNTALSSNSGTHNIQTRELLVRCARPQCAAASSSHLPARGMGVDCPTRPSRCLQNSAPPSPQTITLISHLVALRGFRHTASATRSCNPEMQINRMLPLKPVAESHAPHSSLVSQFTAANP